MHVDKCVCIGHGLGHDLQVSVEKNLKAVALGDVENKGIHSLILICL